MSRPAVLFGGPSPEHDVSILTGLQACRALSGTGDVTALYWAKSGEWFEVAPDLEAAAFVDGVPAKAQRVELVALPGGGFVGEARLGRRRPLEISAAVNCCHGGPGEDGTLQGALDLAGVRYTGPGVAGSALGMDKLAFGAAVGAAGLDALPRRLLRADGPDPDFDGPYIVKPRYGGSSLGIEVTDDLAVARDLVRTQPLLRGGAVVEPYRPEAVDLNVSVRTHPERQTSAVEKPLRGEGGRIYSYVEKYLGGEGMASAARELPAQLPDGLEDRIRTAAATITEIAEVRGVVRIDFLWQGDDLWVNEINTVPGSLARYFWDHHGVPFAQLLRDMLDEAERTPTHRYSTEGADGTALRAAGSIAGKLA